MRKLLTIGWKDLTLTFRDRAALILMLAAPFLLTLGMGFVSGRFSGGSRTGLSAIPVAVVNQDGGELGQALADVFASDEVAELVAPVILSDPAEARRQVQADELAAAVIIPAGFTDSLMPDLTTGRTGPAAAVEVYANPARPTGAGVVQSIVTTFVDKVETMRVTGLVSLEQLLASGRVTPQQLASQGSLLVGQLVGPLRQGALIGLDSSAAAPDDAEFDVLAFFAPGMAMLFLMYTVTHGGRSLLAERDAGTLGRLLTTPTSAAQVLGGKVFGIFLTGAAQVGILILGTSLMFGLKWGDPLGVAVLVLAVAAAATGWGLLLAASARTPGQVASVGSALMLLFGILSGIFVPLTSLPGWVRLASRLTPNAWGLDGFTTLGAGGTLAGVLAPVAALLGMAAVLFGLAVLVFRRSRGLALR
jgi:ABC-2 type transport system permease protein